MANVGLFKVLLSSTIAIIILVCVYVRKFHSTPSPRKRVVLGDDHALEPPHEVKGPLPDDGSDTASLSTLQTLTPPMKIYRPKDSSPSTVYPEYQEAPSPRAPDGSHQRSFSAYKLTNLPATEQGEHHGLSMV